MTQNKKIIAITGGIGSGKSTVSSILRKWGYYVLSCDEIYSELLEGKDLIGKIEEKLGKVSNEDGTLNRKKLSEKVFSDGSSRKILDDITHPVIMDEMFNRANVANDSIVFCEVPLLFENGFEKLFDNVIVVMRDRQSRVEAVMKRSGLSEDQVLARMAAQFDYDCISKNDFIVINNYDNIDRLQCTMREIINNI